MDAAFCVAADGQNMASTGWCIMNCGLPAPQTNCDAQLCYCSDVQRVLTLTLTPTLTLTLSMTLTLALTRNPTPTPTPTQPLS